LGGIGGIYPANSQPNGQTAQSIRTVTIDGSPWFVLKDACRALALKEHHRGGFYNQARHLDPEELRVIRKAPANFAGIFEGTASQVQLVSESGLYKLILRAHKSPVAKPFQDWVTKVVLPAIRKDGAYVMGEEKVTTGEERGPSRAGSGLPSKLVT
jgi:prophage antirepressor-like protein